MTKRQYHIAILVVIALSCIAGPLGWFGYKASQERAAMELELERERTKQSRQRWEAADKMWKRLPLVD